MLSVFFFFNDTPTTEIYTYCHTLSLHRRSSDRTLNILTLGAMSVAAGRVIDDAIVVIENIHRLLEEGRTRSEAVLEGTSQMVPAITASTDRKSTRLNSSH